MACVAQALEQIEPQCAAMGIHKGRFWSTPASLARASIRTIVHHEKKELGASVEGKKTVCLLDCGKLVSFWKNAEAGEFSWENPQSINDVGVERSKEYIVALGDCFDYVVLIFDGASKSFPPKGETKEHRAFTAAVNVGKAAFLEFALNTLPQEDLQAVQREWANIKRVVLDWSLLMSPESKTRMVKRALVVLQIEHDNEPVDFHKLGSIVSKVKKAGKSYSGKDILSILPSNGSNRFSVRSLLYGLLSALTTKQMLSPSVKANAGAAECSSQRCCCAECSLNKGCRRLGSNAGIHRDGGDANGGRCGGGCSRRTARPHRVHLFWRSWRHGPHRFRRRTLAFRP